jgi:hypothetical protein
MRLYLVHLRGAAMSALGCSFVSRSEYRFNWQVRIVPSRNVEQLCRRFRYQKKPL